MNLFNVILKSGRKGRKLDVNYVDICAFFFDIHTPTYTSSILVKFRMSMYVYSAGLDQTPTNALIDNNFQFPFHDLKYVMR